MPESLPWDQLTNNNPLTPDSPHPVIVIGAGLAGCWIARTLAESGTRVTVLEAGAGPASGASKNPAGIVKPFVTRRPSLAMSFYIEAHRYLLERLSQWQLLKACGFTRCGVVQLVDRQYPVSKHFSCVTPGDMSDVLGVESDSHGLNFDQSGWLNPFALCQSLLQHQLITVRCQCSVHAIEPSEQDHWRIRVGDSSTSLSDHQISGEHVVVTTGTALNKLQLTRHLTMTPARGQISRFAYRSAATRLSRVVSGKHYIIPDNNTVIVGATFERGIDDDSISPEDDRANRHGADTTLTALDILDRPTEAYAGVRATTPDRLPLVGPLPDSSACALAYADLQHGRPKDSYPSLPIHSGVFVLGGLGSRGIVTAPFAASLLVDHMMGHDDITQWTPLLNPARFQIRRLKRNGTG